eukprot:6180214-Pleurochrysis_carterae.AAC.1
MQTPLSPRCEAYFTLYVIKPTLRPGASESAPPIEPLGQSVRRAECPLGPEARRLASASPVGYILSRPSAPHTDPRPGSEVEGGHNIAPAESLACSAIVRARSLECCGQARTFSLVRGCELSADPPLWPHAVKAGWANGRAKQVSRQAWGVMGELEHRCGCAMSGSDRAQSQKYSAVATREPLGLGSRIVRH